MHTCCDSFVYIRYFGIVVAMCAYIVFAVLCVRHVCVHVCVPLLRCCNVVLSAHIAMLRFIHYDPLLWCSMFPHGYVHAMLCCLLTPLCCGSFMYDPWLCCSMFAHGCDHAMSTIDIVLFWLLRYGFMPLLTTYANMFESIVKCNVRRYFCSFFLRFITIALSLLEPLITFH